jgi:hypothetical protein
MMEVRATRQPAGWGFGIESRVLDREQRQYVKRAELELVTPDNPNPVIPPVAVIEDRETQMLMDQLWDCGLRPSEGSGSAGALAATERHLADLRRLLLKRAGIQEKENER